MNHVKLDISFFKNYKTIFFYQVLAVSTVVNQSILRPYVFRNYRHRHELRSHYPGSCSHKLWEALRASSAAPGYFEEFKLGRDIHQVRKLSQNTSHVRRTLPVGIDQAHNFPSVVTVDQ